MSDEEVNELVTDDGSDAAISAAFRALGDHAAGDDELALRRLSARIAESAQPSLLALRNRSHAVVAAERSWRLKTRFAAPLALAATLLIAFVVTQSPAATQDQSVAEADTSALLFNVMMKRVGADDAARTLAAGGAGATDLWTRIDD